MGASSKENPKSREKENGGAVNEQQRNIADDVIGKRHSDNGLHKDNGVQYP